MKTSSRNDRQRQMHAHIEAWQHSGLTQKDYCHQHDIKIYVFRYWLAKYRNGGTAEEGFVPVVTDPAAATAGAGIHIRYPSGVEVQLPAHTPLATIRSLIATPMGHV